MRPTLSPLRIPPPALTLAGLLVAGALSGCAMTQSTGNLLGIISPYRVEVVQGNVVTSEQAALIKPGMARNQVRDILGSPLLTDIFHNDRWDYVFTIRRQGILSQQRNVLVVFEGDKVARIEAPELPSEREFVSSIDRPRSRRDLPVLVLSEEQVKALPVPPRPAPPPPPPETPTRSYPPLEPVG